MLRFTIIIPSRFDSERLPGKALLDIAGKTMIQRVYEQAIQSDAVKVIVATDDQRIADTVATFGGDVCMTSASHLSGTDRIQEVVSIRGFKQDEIVVNVQGDEPLIPPEVINQVAENLRRSSMPMATLFEQIVTLEDLKDPNIVKLVCSLDDKALYFSRAPIPFDRDLATTMNKGGFKRHIGLYAYRASLLNDFVSWKADELELIEKLEQLRVLRKGLDIHVAEAVKAIPPGIDTEKDLERARALF
ncbi:MAG: 3-deoxy-manno-octulosonate cytidylyltransferase [Pseudomonadales bacterium]|nr:3-deoxy-manno-octulosonate cytidylyltransferase [Pseudomonadales bacterium]